MNNATTPFDAIRQDLLTYDNDTRSEGDGMSAVYLTKFVEHSRRLLELLDERDEEEDAAISDSYLLAEAREKAIEDAAGYVLRIDMSKVLAGQIANGIRSLKPQRNPTDHA